MRYLAIIAPLLFSLSAKSISIPCATITASDDILLKNISLPGSDALTWLFNLKPREITELTGRKLNLKEKIAFALIKHKIKRQASHPVRKKIHDDGQAAFILGLTGLIVLLIPFLDVASIPLAILAIVIGNKAKREDPHDRRARTGVTLGIITLGVLIVIGLIVALVLTIGQSPR